MDELTIIIHWKGPYPYDEVLDSDEGNGLYLIAGIQKNKSLNEIQYCGITEGKFSRRLDSYHHHIPQIQRKLSIWLGNIYYPQPSSRIHLETAEKIIVYFWQPDLNDRKRMSLPKPTTVISHWYKKNGDPRVRQHNLSNNLHDVLAWDGSYWRTGNLSVYGD